MRWRRGHQEWGEEPAIMKVGAKNRVTEGPRSHADQSRLEGVDQMENRARAEVPMFQSPAKLFT